MSRSTQRTKPTAAEAAKLNEALQTLHNYCAKGVCNGCPFKREKQPVYGTSCKFGSFYPELWDGLEIKEDNHAE